MSAPDSSSSLAVTPIKQTGMPQLSTTVRVYVLAIQGVPTSIENTTTFEEGISLIAGIQDFAVSVGLVQSYVHCFLNVTVVTSWQTYKDLVLTGEDLVMINSHGEYLPVPAGYSPSQWFSNVLDAISNRSNAWVHVEGFPFYYAWSEGNGSSLLGTAPFQQLVSLTGLPPALSLSPNVEYSQTLAANYAGSALSGSAVSPLLGFQWVHSAGPVLELPTHSSFSPLPGTGEPFNPSYRDFYSTMFALNSTYPAAAATFRINGTSKDSYGLYSHYVGSTVANTPSVGYDWVRGIISLLMPISWEVLETGSSILYGLGQINDDQANGRTIGLLSAVNLLSTAVREFQAGLDLSAWLDSSKAVSASLAATLPWPLQYLKPYWSYITFFILLILMGVFASRRSVAIISEIFSRTIGRPRSIKRVRTNSPIFPPSRKHLISRRSPRK